MSSDQAEVSIKQCFDTLFDKCVKEYNIKRTQATASEIIIKSIGTNKKYVSLTYIIFASFL
jgi:hypothetical protein